VLLERETPELALLVRGGVKREREKKIKNVSPDEALPNSGVSSVEAPSSP
jgi:hypothetical protein